MNDIKKLKNLIEMQTRLNTLNIYKQAIKQVADSIYKYDASKSIKPAIIPVESLN